MALNPQYDAIGKGFVQQYYTLFDDPAQRANLANMYNVETSFMTFEGVQIQGAAKIMEKLNTDEDLPHGYLQTFVLKPIGNSFYVEHDMFRLALHDIVTTTRLTPTCRRSSSSRSLTPTSSNTTSSASGSTT
ncbi:unnamed protein product [Leptidea sinapis]|uniref:NTF2-related export protein n=1 Tax=Leptidea sinapis TaxID=189913 RepID=A0A5E4QXJ8_9NEOP|nr:unnamed protein product [Leptidea sinapis]